MEHKAMLRTTGSVAIEAKNKTLPYLILYIYNFLYNFWQIPSMFIQDVFW